MFYINKIMHTVHTLCISMFPTIYQKHHLNNNVHYSDENELHIIPPRSNKMER